jgi:chromosome segregation ATPase
MPKKEELLDADEARLCLLEFGSEDLINDIVNFKEELRVLQDKCAETQKTVDILSESLINTKNNDLIDLNSFRKLKQDLSDFKFILSTQTTGINTLGDQIKNHQKVFQETVAEIEKLKKKIAKSAPRLLEFK